MAEKSNYAVGCDLLNLSKKRKPAGNKGFSAMLAEEYKLIDISLISCSPG